MTLFSRLTASRGQGERAEVAYSEHRAYQEPGQTFNAIVHPWTLRIQLTHLLPWPSEGTVRVIALAICLVAVATRRYLQATATWQGQAATVPEKAGVAA